ncbi:optineurin isoform X2 [Anabrus simplex]|uniref:optineurin isoform X2 n=1 Tax=Anabrus simplex TaxID=316456 RepID=UPI0034DCCA6F
MMKVTDKHDIQNHGFGPESSITSEGSFVVLERSSVQEPDASRFSNCAPPLMVSPIYPQSSSNVSGPQPESQSSSFLPGSMPSDLSPEEIQRKLRELLQENVELKETLHQNNLAMKQQFNTLVMWQDEVFKVHQSHKEKFAETKDLILKLRAENAELKKYLEQSKTGSVSDNQLKAENAKLKGQIAELQQKLSAPVARKDHPAGPPSRKEEELSDLVKQLNKQLETAERARRQLILDKERLTAQKTRLERDVTALKEEMEEHKEKNRTLLQEKDELLQKVNQHEQELREFVVVEKQQQLAGHASLSEEVQQLKEALDQERARVAALELQVQKEQVIARQTSSNQETTTKSTSLTEGGSSTQFGSNLKNYEEKLHLFNHSLEKQTERYASLDSWLQVAADNVSQWKGTQLKDPQGLDHLRSEIDDLRRLLAKEKAYSEEKKKNLADAATQFQSLFTEYQSLLNEWESYHQEEKAKARHNDAYHDVQARGFSEKLDNLTAQVLCKDEELAEKTKEITQLKEKVKKLEVENEAITILKAQVEVYQSDFNAEREARENLAGEKERLAEDLRLLQRRNQQLLEEVEKLRSNTEPSQNRKTSPSFPNSGWSTIGTPGRSASSTSRMRHSPAPEETQQRDESENELLFCPKCELSFTSLKPLEQHVDSCLDLLP